MGAIRGSSYYTVVDGPRWEQAEANARSLGGHLVSFGTKKEEKFVINYVESVSREAWWWMGLEYDSSTSSMRWNNGEKYNYKNWYEGSGVKYPDVSIELNHYKYTEFTADPGRNWAGAKPSDGQWAIALPTSSRRGVAEIPLSYFSISDAEVEEGEKGKIKITRTGGTSTEQTLILATSDGSAVEGDDYKKKTKTITFAAGETSKTVNIVTNEDISVESDETIKLTLSASSGDTVPAQIQNGSAILTIKNDEFKFGNSLYTVVNGSSWTEAQKEAEKLGGNLVTINNAEENDWLHSQFGIYKNTLTQPVKDSELDLY